MDFGPTLRLWRESERSTAPSSVDMASRYRGVLQGIAVGNLLGLPVEGLGRKQVERYYPDGLAEIDPREKNRPWDDDVAQTVILAQSILEKGSVELDDLADRLVQWARTNGRGMGGLTWRVLQELELGARPAEASRIVWEDDPRQPAGNGAVMRCSPVALRWRRDPAQLVQQALASAYVTHYDPRCQWSVVATSLALALTLEGKRVEPAVLGIALREMGAPGQAVKTLQFSEGASLDSLDLDEPHTMGFTLKAMQVGLWALTQGEDFEKSLMGVVNAGGDTDTNGAIAGAALGGRFGVREIPPRWLDNVPQREILQGLADKLLRASGSN